MGIGHDTRQLVLLLRGSLNHWHDLIRTRFAQDIILFLVCGHTRTPESVELIPPEKTTPSLPPPPH